MATPQLPASFRAAGLLPYSVPALRGLMLSISGPPDTGKTELAMSAPGPGVHLALDRGIDGAMQNPKPPKSRNPNFAFKRLPAPLANSQPTQAEYLAYWKDFYAAYKMALALPDARTVILDGDSDSWEVQRLAEFGRISKIPSLSYDNVNSARRAFYNRAHDSGKIFIATSRVARVYAEKIGPTGDPVLGNDGKPIREWDGKTYEKKGFADQDYFWQICVHTSYDPDMGVFGCKIVKCKFDKEVVGVELWGEDCTFSGIVQTILPDVPLAAWGFK